MISNIGDRIGIDPRIAVQIVAAVGLVEYAATDSSNYAAIYSDLQSYFSPTKPPPQMPLVGIETNPGPKPRNNRGKAKNTPFAKLATAIAALPKPQQARANPRRRRAKRSGGITENAGLSDNRVDTISAPAAFGSIRRQYTHFGAANFGVYNGLKITGRQRLGTATITSTNVFFDGGANHYKYVDPTLMGVPLSLFSGAFQRFRFTRLAFEYVSQCPSSNTGSIVLGYTSDSNSSTGSLTVANIVSLENSVETNCWASAAVDCAYSQDNLLYTYGVFTGTADKRTSAQGVVLINGNCTAADGTQIGTVWVTYTLELYELGYEAGLLYNSLYHSPNNIVRGSDDDSKGSLGSPFTVVSKTV